MELDCYHSSASVLAALSSIAECRVKEVKASVEGERIIEDISIDVIIHFD